MSGLSKICFFLGFILLVLKAIGLINISFSNQFISFQENFGRTRVPYKKIEVLDDLISYLDGKLSGQKRKSVSKYENGNLYKFDIHKENTIELIKQKVINCSTISPSFGLYFSPYYKRTDLDGSKISEPIKQIQIGNGSNYCSFQIVITSYDTIREIKVTHSNELENPNFYLGEYVKIKNSAFSNEELIIQDPLIPMVKYDDNIFKTYRDSFKIKGNKCYPIWCEFRLNNLTGFKGLINVEAKNNKGEITEYKIPINLSKKVHKPKKQKIYSFLRYDHRSTQRYYKNDSLVKACYNNNLDFLLNYNLFPINLYPSAAEVMHDSVLLSWGKMKSKGAEVFFLRYIDTPVFEMLLDSLDYRNEFLLGLKIQEKTLSQMGLLDNSYIYLFDELSEKFNHYLDFTVNLLKDNGIESKLVSTALRPNENSELDFHCPIVGLQNIKYQDEKWGYICCSSPIDYNLLLESPLEASANLYELASENNITHFLYYSINNWKGNIFEDRKNYKPFDNLYENEYKHISKGKRWPNVPWVPYSATRCTQFNGDGYLIYPGDNGEFWPSVRLINFCIRFGTIE